MELIRQRKVKLSLDMAPLVDVVFQLLIFFMLTTTLSAPSIRLNLPSAGVQDQGQQERIVISMTGSGEIFLNNQPTSLGAIKSDIERLLQGSSIKAIHIRGDADMSYKYFVQVMDSARQAGARHINIVHGEVLKNIKN